MKIFFKSAELFSKSNVELYQLVIIYFLLLCRIPAGKCLFDGYLNNLTTGNSDPERSFCSCLVNVTLCDSGSYDNITNQWEPSQPVTPNIPSTHLPNITNNSITATDNVDYYYNSLGYNSTALTNVTTQTWNFTWPTSNNITYNQTYQKCYAMLWTNLTAQRVCSGYLPTSSVSGIVNKCVSDVQASLLCHSI